MIFDTHAHYDDEVYDADRDQLLRCLPSAGIGKVCNIGASVQGSADSLRLAETYPYVYAAVGVHPDEVAELDEEKFQDLEKMAQHERCVAIGEIGLDYHGYDRFPDKPSKELQLHWFRRQLDLAIRLQKPVVIHSRNAAQDTMEIMRTAHAEGLQDAIIHCFSYSKDVALQYTDMGFFIGFGGVLTYEGQKKVTKALQAIPLDRIVMETDCPYLTPLPLRQEGQGRGEYVRNTSLSLPLVRDKMAELLDLPAQEVERLTWENAHRVYRIGLSPA